MVNRLAPLPPGFLESFPREPSLDELVRAFLAGNYRRVRAEAPAVITRAREAGNELLAQKAEELVARTNPGPWTAYVYGLVVLLVLGVSWFVYAKGAR